MNKIPLEVQPLVAKLTGELTQSLGDNLVGIYVHGSIAMDCFNPESSDVDVLVVVNESLAVKAKKRLGNILLAVSSKKQFPVELSVITMQQIEHFEYPTPYEFHYGEDHRQIFEQEEAVFDKGVTDPDLAAHFVITKKFGITLVGPSAQSIFPDVPREFYLDSIIQDSLWSYDNIMAGPDEGSCLVPTYAVVNFCRVLAFIDGGLVLSKNAGAEWAKTHLSAEFLTVILAALNEYAQTESSPEIDCKTLKRFAKFAHRKIVASGRDSSIN